MTGICNTRDSKAQPYCTLLSDSLCISVLRLGGIPLQLFVVVGGWERRLGGVLPRVVNTERGALFNHTNRTRTQVYADAGDAPRVPHPLPHTQQVYNTFCYTMRLFWESRTRDKMRSPQRLRA